MDKGIGLSARACVRDRVLSRELDGELVVLDLNTGVYFGLNATGTRIWNLLERTSSLGRVLDALVEEYDVSEPRCRKDLLQFVGTLVQHNLMELRAADHP